MKSSLRILLFFFIAIPGVCFLFSAKPGDDEKPVRSTSNPLMPGSNEVFDFARVTPEAIKSASMYTENQVTMLLSAIGGIDDTKRTFGNTMMQVDEIYNTLLKSISVYELLGSTHPDKETRDLAGKMQEKFTTMTDELAQNEMLFKAVKSYSESAEAKTLKGERAYFISHTLMEYNLNGMSLSPAKRDSLKTYNSKLNELNVAFSKNIAEDQTKVKFKKEELEGLSAEFLAKYLIDQTGIYEFDLSSPTYSPFMSQCSNWRTRKTLYQAKMNVGGVANEELLVKILGIRTKKAQLLGFKTYAEYATKDIMAQNTANVWKFEKGLAADLRPKAKADYDKLMVMKARLSSRDGGTTTIYPYDYAYYTNELLKSEYKVDPEKVKEYFEINKVIGGIFTVYQSLYNLRFEEDKNPSTWHKEVKAYTVYDITTKERIGYFYLDLYPRENKYKHFACFPLTGSKTYPNGSKQLKSAALVCNFPQGTETQPSLLPHGTVITFFHEFGHLIHVLLSETELAAFAGTNVATDFVEAPSQIMENWAWQKDVLSLFARHYKTGEVIPDTLLDRMIAARNLNSGLNTLQQVFYGTLDFTLNDNPPPHTAGEIVKITGTLQNSITLFPWVEGTHFASSFGHLTGYGSRYYGYLWSLVYSADMFSVFKEKGYMKAETGQAYRSAVLAKGGSDDAINLVRNFLGREPNNKAFLKQIGL
jgi:thimet oligopeptidase